MSAWSGSLLVVGHRGGRGEGWPPENTLAAFERARREGARAIELDVRTCAEGTPIVFHDETLARMTGGRDRRLVCDVNEDELGRIDLGAAATIPTLDDVLRWARRSDVAVNVEIKHDVPSAPPQRSSTPARRRCISRLRLIRATAAAVRGSGADVILSSFDPALLALAAVLAPALPRALLTQCRQPAWANALQEAARPPLVRSVHLEQSSIAVDLVRRYRHRGLLVGAWTVNDPAEARDLVRFGVTSIITDRPGEILRAL